MKFLKITLLLFTLSLVSCKDKSPDKVTFEDISAKITPYCAKYPSFHPITAMVCRGFLLGEECALHPGIPECKEIEDQFRSLPNAANK